ncbi:hypothetical protein KIL84_021771 [Mauremys mutica]|uniref:Epidermal growth factor-like protein 7 n=1 Tax=Mauremys mutica TaxID=74926 RepID=A0A9D4B2J8_9SAUR|nr:hypothetical protein KIL84_021771 [Mauremys mutica]
MQPWSKRAQLHRRQWRCILLHWSCVCPMEGFSHHIPYLHSGPDPRCSMPAAFASSETRCLLSSRRVCSAEMQNRAASYVESHVQPVYQPYLTTCQGHRLCSTYRTTYKVAYRLAYRRFSQPIYMCCPGWRRANGHAVGCSKAICRLPCQNGGSCSAPDRCTCPPGWMGKSCQTDVDECAGPSHGCSQHCANTPGSYGCACRAGQRLSADGKSCQASDPPTETEASPALNRSGSTAWAGASPGACC